MRFTLVDRILEVEAGRRIRVLKNLTLGGEDLAAPFSNIPGNPGVFVPETLGEAGALLLRLTEDFRHSIITLREAKNVKYGHFMDPGRQLIVTAEMAEDDGRVAAFKVKGEV